MHWLVLTALAVPRAEARPWTVAGGLRNTVSTFEEGRFGPPGTGTGGQLRVQHGDRVGTVWFYDYITSPLDGRRGARVDQHIGWSVLFSPWRIGGGGRLLPHVLAGHCFDQARIGLRQGRSAARLSSAAQAGAGSHLVLTDRVDLSLSGQYMVHLGRDLHRHAHAAEHGHGTTLEGHLLFTLSVNVRLFGPGRSS